MTIKGCGLVVTVGYTFLSACGGLKLSDSASFIKREDVPETASRSRAFCQTFEKLYVRPDMQLELHSTENMSQFDPTGQIVKEVQTVQTAECGAHSARLEIGSQIDFSDGSRKQRLARYAFNLIGSNVEVDTENFDVATDGTRTPMNQENQLTEVEVSFDEQSLAINTVADDRNVPGTKTCSLDGGQTNFACVAEAIQKAALSSGGLTEISAGLRLSKVLDNGELELLMDNTPGSVIYLEKR